MEGKIFSESSNIYQDQAKILFDYYKASAEKIVTQEREIEMQIDKVKSEIEIAVKDQASVKTAMIIWFCTLIGFIMGIVKYMKLKQIGVHIESLQTRIKALEKQHKEIFRDYKIEKLGVAYVPVASRVAFNDKSFLVDHTGSTANEQFTLQILRQNQLIKSSIDELRSLTQEAPIVEESNQVERVETSNYSKSIQSVNFHDYFGKLDRTLRTISFCLSDKDETTVELPVIFPDTSYATFLNNYATQNVGDCPIFKIFNTSQHDAQINGFKELNETRKSISSDSEEVDKTLRNLMVDMASSVQTTSQMKVTSVKSLVDYSNKLLFNILKAPYNFYSPMLEAEEIDRIKHESFNYGDSDGNYKPFDLRESSRMRFDLISMCWADGSGSRSIAPFGVNQIQSEIMAPIVSNLLKETYKDRLNVYNHIKDQKIDYLNQWHRDTEDFYGRNRAEASDLINLMRANLTEYTAAYNTLVAFKKTEENMRNNVSLESGVTEVEDNSAEVLIAYQQQSEQFKQAQDEFASYMERLHDDIDIKAEKFGHVEHYDASLRDKQSKDMALAVDNVSNLDARRKPLSEVSPLLAQITDLPPAPAVEDITYEHIGVNLVSMAQSAIEDLNRVANSVVSHSDIVTNESEEEMAEEVAEEIVEEVAEEIAEDVVEETAEEDSEYDEDDDDEDDDDEEEEEVDFVVGMEVYDIDEDGNKVPYADGVYNDEEGGRKITVKDGIVTAIEPQSGDEDNQ